MKNIENIEKIINGCFGLWISSIFSAVCEWNPELSFEEKKEEFFLILEYLLEKKKIKFIKPGADCYISIKNPKPSLSIENPDSHWSASTHEIISNLKEKWPANVTDENDIDLNFYFYEIPGIIWIGENGELVAS